MFIFWSHQSSMLCLLFVVFKRAFLIYHIFYTADTSHSNNMHVYMHSCPHMLLCILWPTFSTYTMYMASMRNVVCKIFNNFLTTHSIHYSFYLHICHQYMSQHLQVWVPSTTSTIHFYLKYGFSGVHFLYIIYIMYVLHSKSSSYVCTCSAALLLYSQTFYLYVCISLSHKHNLAHMRNGVSKIFIDFLTIHSIHYSFLPSHMSSIHISASSCLDPIDHIDHSFFWPEIWVFRRAFSVYYIHYTFVVF